MSAAKIFTVRDTAGEIRWVNADHILDMCVEPDGTTRIKRTTGGDILTPRRASDISNAIAGNYNPPAGADDDAGPAVGPGTLDADA